MKLNPKKSAFTLVELIMVVALLALLGGAIAGILQGSVTSAAALTEVSNRQSQVQAFLQLLTSTFRNLESGTLFMAQKNPIVDQSNLFLMFNNSHQLFKWHRDQSKFPAKLLTSWPNEKGLQTLGILEYNRYFKLASSTASSSTTFSATGWTNKIDLLTDIRSVSWRFWNQRTKAWSDDWRNPSQRPDGVELTLHLAESTHPTIHFFYLPPVYIQSFLVTLPNEAPATK